MSKLINMYKSLKNENPEVLYLFKSGIFYIFLDADAKIVSNLLCLKLTNLNPEILKCGFPESSLNKYLNLLAVTPYTVKIIDNSSNTSFDVKQFTMNQDNLNLLTLLSNTDENSLSVKEAYEFISHTRDLASQILKGVNLDGR